MTIFHARFYCHSSYLCELDSVSRSSCLVAASAFSNSTRPKQNWLLIQVLPVSLLHVVTKLGEKSNERNASLYPYDILISQPNDR